MTVQSSVSKNEEDVEGISKGDALDKETQLAKFERIRSAIRLNDVLALKSAAAEPGGLVEDTLRKESWPLILKIDPDLVPEASSQEEVEKHRYYQQVLMDVARSIRRFPPSIASEKRMNLQDKLVNVIMRVLVANPDLHYYQGYHDICVTVLLVVDGDEDLAFQIMNEISRTRLRVFMEETMKPTECQLNYIYAIFQAEDPKLRKFLERAECRVIFCLSWCLTWFGHDLENYSNLVRLYDLFLANDENQYLLPVYVAAAVVLSRSKSLQLQECSLPSVHSYLRDVLIDLDNHPSELEDCIFHAKKLHALYPVERLEQIEAEKRRQDEEYRRWRRSFLGMTLLRLKRVDWKSRGLAGAVLVLSVAIGYQMYRRSITSIAEA
ncbi:TBC1 domain family member 20 [Galendromus occidentalis]|uniref:TBC1 domain family member 20 n=1 Tax=Galendromus occidentalis TaxID=34638 RepID=A0AAJ6QQ64_9ACAR|nr:TBC1 domain family member 20 [Galendromus occidentalis]